MSGPDRVSVPGQGQALDYLGGKPVSELIGADCTIEWSGVDGAVKGTIKKQTDFAAFSAKQKTGHFFPVELSEKYEGAPVTVDNGDGKPKTETDRHWTIRVENIKGTRVTFSAAGETIATLDFSGATLEGADG